MWQVNRILIDKIAQTGNNLRIRIRELLICTLLRNQWLAADIYIETFNANEYEESIVYVAYSNFCGM
jgi:hypothetical protein